MFRVLIVDDEILAVRFLEGLIPWEEHGYHVVGHALTAAGALRLAGELAPDLVFMDMKLLDTDGIELSRRILTLRPRAKIIALTAYSDFSFARQAVRLGISDFLLKHELDGEGLLRALEAVDREIRRDRELLAGAVAQWIAACIQGEGRGEPPLKLGKDCAYVLLMAQHSQAHTLFEQKRSLSLGEWEEGEGRMLGAAELEGNCLAALWEAPSARLRGDGLLELVHSFRRRLRSLLGREPVVAYSELYSAPGALSWSGAFRRLAAGLFTSPVTLVSGSQLAAAPPHRIPWPDRYGAKGLEGVAAGDPAVLEWICAPLQESPPGCLVEWGDLAPLRALIQQVNRWKVRQGLPTYAQLLDRGEDAALPHCLSGLEEWLREDLGQCLGRADGDTAGVVWARKAGEYIRERFSEDLTAGSVARTLGLSEGYLRAVFREEMGCTLWDYLTARRVEEARRLLRENKHKMYEIAAQCGFKTSQHFSQVFRAQVGKTPSEYAKAGEEN